MSKKKFYEINQYIKSPMLRLVDKDGEQLGVVSKEEALRLAKDRSLDVVVVAPTAKPPVAKIIDFSNFKYQIKKKNQSGKKSKTEVKEIRLTPFIAENDLKTRLKKATEFLEDGDRVKINVKFVGRQITRKEFGEQLLEGVVTDLAEVGSVDQPAKMQGKIMSMTIKPKPKAKK